MIDVEPVCSLQCSIIAFNATLSPLLTFTISPTKIVKFLFKISRVDILINYQYFVLSVVAAHHVFPYKSATTNQRSALARSALPLGAAKNYVKFIQDI
jgi:hypothetical protein